MTVLRTHELRQVQTEVRASRTEIGELQKALDELSLQQGGTTSQMRADLTSILTDLQGQIGRLHSQIDETQQRLALLNQRLDRLDPARAPAPAPNGGTRGGPAGTQPPPRIDFGHLFNQAREDYIRGRYDLAYQGFKAIYEHAEAGLYAERALYWMAESLLMGERPERALELYQRLLAEFPAGENRCAAQLKIGILQERAGDTSARNQTWTRLIANCPESNEAERARELLR